MNKKLILGASIGNCVHVAGIIHFLQLAEAEGYQTKFLGPAVSIDTLFHNIYHLHPEIVSISYRLTPENVIPLLDEIDLRRKQLPFSVRWEFGGTKPVADIAQKYNFFEFISDGYDEISDSIRYLRGIPTIDSPAGYGSSLISRLDANRPYPLLRHHFGRPDLEETIQGISDISKAKVLDIISLGPDQNAQQFFFKPQKMKPEYTGAGGVPIRSNDDFLRLKAASYTGNYPLMRCYSGTEDIFPYAQMLIDTIDNAWSAIPLCWYNELDGRSTRPLEKSIIQSLELIRWHAEKGIPVEINEPHHWGLRDAHDVIPVVMSYISAYNAKKLGVTHYIAQYMFNNPNGLSFSMDFAKILAMMELTESLQDKHFHIYRQTRAGLSLFHADSDVAKGQLAASSFMQMALKPDIIHVVGFCEANHAASASEVKESCRIVRGVIRHTLNEDFSMQNNISIMKRKDELIKEAHFLLNFIQNEYADYPDPLANSSVLCDCIKKGYIDAVHILKNNKFHGNLLTKIIDGKCLAWDTEKNRPVTEEERLNNLKNYNLSLTSEDTI